MKATTTTPPHLPLPLSRPHSRTTRVLTLLLFLAVATARRGVDAVARLLELVPWGLARPLAKALRVVARRIHATARGVYAYQRNLPPPVDPNVDVTWEVKTPMEDGVELNGTLLLPSPELRRKIDDQNGKVPMVLIRTPYGRLSPFIGVNLGVVFAERGFGCLVQDTRGRFGSGGDFFPIAQERKDGGAAVAWLAKQPFCNGRIGTFGVSYLGLTAYAAAGGAPPGLVRSVVPLMASARIFPILFHGDTTLALDLVFRWLWIVLVVQRSNPLAALWKVLTPHRQLKDALDPSHETPIHARDKLLLGTEFGFFQEVVRANDPKHEFWADKDVLCDVADASRPPPALSILSGWHDFFNKQSFEDFHAASRVATDAPLELTVGPWSHWDLTYSNAGFCLALESFARTLVADADSATPEAEVKRNPADARPTRVNVFILHSERYCADNRGVWKSYDHWPPREARLTSLELGSGGRLRDPLLRQAWGGGAAFSTHTYDPFNPTPHAGGPSFDWNNTGRVTQNELETRKDVLVFSSPLLAEPIFVVGDVVVELEMTTDNPHIDVFVKLCDVDTSGKSWNVAEKLVRLGRKDFDQTRGGGCGWGCGVGEGEEDDDKGEFDARVTVSLGAVAACFALGHRVRLQVSGGAHPVYLRHHGTTDHPAFTTDEMRTSTRHIHHALTSSESNNDETDGVGRRRRVSRVVLPLVDVA